MACDALEYHVHGELLDEMPRSISSHVTGVDTLATVVGRTQYTLASVRPHAFWL